MGVTVSQGGSSILGNNRGIAITSTVASYDPDAEIIFAAMTPAPTTARKALINSFVLGCKEDGNWSLLDVVGFLAATNSASALLNWKSPSTFIPAAVSSPTFTTDRGFTGNGSSSYINTNYNPFTQGINFTLNSHSFGCYNLTDSSGFYMDMGSNDAGVGELIFSRDGTGAYAYMANADPTAAGTVATAVGLTSGKRTTSNAFGVYKNGVLLASETTAADHIGNYNFFLLAGNQNGSADFFANRQMAFYFMGSGAINHLTLYNRVVTYLTGIGAL